MTARRSPEADTVGVEHPAYPPHNGDPQADRCVCGGIRHWHAVAPYGCDDCDCTEFREQVSGS